MDLQCRVRLPNTDVAVSAPSPELGALNGTSRGEPSQDNYLWSCCRRSGRGDDCLSIEVRWYYRNHGSA